MKKILLFVMIGMLLVGGTIAITFLDNGDALLTEDDLLSLSNQQIGNYMENKTQFTRYKLLPEKILTYYNITYIEPTHDENNSYRVFTQEKPFSISRDIWNLCVNKTTKANCKHILVDSDTEQIFTINESYAEGNETFYELRNITMTSTYLQAYNEQLRQFEFAKSLRDNIATNELKDLEELL